MDLVGNKYSRLTVIEMLPNYRQNSSGRNLTYCVCECDCGTKNVIVRASNLKAGETRSCGCLRRERCAEATRARSKTHGKSNTKAYAVWLAMRNRCYLPTLDEYKHYGGRGIKVCDEWKDDFQAFYDWLIAHGYCESETRNSQFTIDRIDVDGDYTPDNCRLVSFIEQANNKRNNRRITYNGETHTMAEWARIRGMKYKSFANRLYKGWSMERVMTE